MPTPTDRIISWQIGLESDLAEKFAQDQTAFVRYQKAIQDVVDELGTKFQQGTIQSKDYSDAMIEMAGAAEAAIPGASDAIKKLTENFDPKFIQKFHKELFGTLSYAGKVDIQPIFEFARLAEEAKRAKAFTDLMGKTGKDFAIAFEHSSIPILRKVWKHLEKEPNLGEIEKSLQKVFVAFSKDPSLPLSFFKNLTNPKFLKFWLKEYSKSLNKVAPGTPEFKKALSDLMINAAKKGFLPELAKELEKQGKATSGMFSRIFGKGGGMGERALDALVIAIGDALGDTVKIVTSAITQIFEPLLQMLHYFIKVAIWPIQQAFLTLFASVQPALMDMAAVIGRIVLLLVPLFKVVLTALLPVVNLLAKAIESVEFVLAPVSGLFEGIANILTGSFIPGSGKLGQVLSIIGKRLSWLNVVLKVLGWVLGVLLLPLLIRYTWHLGVKAYGALAHLIQTQWQLIRGLIVSAAKWAHDNNMIRQSTWLYIKNLRIRKGFASFIHNDLVRSLKRVWEMLVLEKWEWIKNHFAQLRHWSSSKLLERQKRHEASAIAASTGAKIADTMAAGRLSKAMSLVGSVALGLSAVFGDQSGILDKVATILMFMGSIVLPLLTTNIKGAAIWEWILTGASWAFNAALWANPITWIVIAVVALTYGIYRLIKAIVGGSPGVIPALLWLGKVFIFVFKIALAPIFLVIEGVKLLWRGIVFLWNWIWSGSGKVRTALLIAMGPLGWAILAVQSLKKVWERLKSWMSEGSSFIGKAIKFMFAPLTWPVLMIKGLIWFFTKLFTWIWSGSSKIKTALLIAMGPLGWAILAIKYVVQHWEELKKSFLAGIEAIGNAFYALWEGFKNSLGAVWEWVKRLIHKIPKPIRWILGINVEDEVVQEGKKSGEAVVSAFAEGEINQQDQVAKATETIAQTADDYLPHSDALKGPLSQLAEAGVNFVSAFSEGIFGQKDYLAECIQQMFVPLMPLIPQPIRSLLAPELPDVTVDVDLDTIMKSTKFAQPIVDAITNQTAALIDFADRTFKQAKDLDVSDLEKLSQFGTI
jgi:hypothetical protein